LLAVLVGVMVLIILKLRAVVVVRDKRAEGLLLVEMAMGAKEHLVILLGEQQHQQDKIQAEPIIMLVAVVVVHLVRREILMIYPHLVMAA
jgi:hypothetical protein